MIRELFKQCGCAPAKWAKCDHPFHFRKQVHGKRWTISLDVWLGHDEVRSIGAAEAVAADMIAAMRAGTFSPRGPAPRPGAPSDGDLRAALDRIEALVRDVIRDVRALRDRQNGGAA